MSARLLSVVGTLDKINIEYSWLIENDDLWEQELLNNYHTLHKLNRKFMQSILQQIGVDDYPIQSPEFSTLTPIVQPHPDQDIWQRLSPCFEHCTCCRKSNRYCLSRHRIPRHRSLLT